MNEEAIKAILSKHTENLAWLIIGLNLVGIVINSVVSYYAKIKFRAREVSFAEQEASDKARIEQLAPKQIQDAMNLLDTLNGFEKRLNSALVKVQLETFKVQNEFTAEAQPERKALAKDIEDAREYVELCTRYFDRDTKISINTILDDMLHLLNPSKPPLQQYDDIMERIRFIAKWSDIQSRLNGLVGIKKLGNVHKAK